MLNALSRLGINRVAVVDDDPDNAAALGVIVEDCGPKPTFITEGFTDVDYLATHVKETADGVLCDHRLSYRTRAAFSGAEAVAKWFDMKVPAILVSEFTDFDTNTTIRQWRRKIPAAIARDVFDVAHMVEGFDICCSEIRNNPPSFRKARRALVRIVELGVDSDIPFVEAVVPQWNPLKVVRFPASLLGSLARSAKPGALFIGKVNIGARNAGELFFEDIELAPEPDPNDGLA